MSKAIQWLLSFFQGVRPAAHLQDTDEDIFPTHLIDNADLIRPCIVSYTFRYQAVIDVSKLRDSLIALTEIGEWRKLRGRLRLNVSLLKILNTWIGR